MTIDAYLTLSLLLGLFVFLVKTKIPAPAVFVGALTIALTLKLAPAHELLKGFSNPGMLTVAVLFMVAVPSIRKARKTSQQKEVEAQLEILAAAIQQLAWDTGRWPRALP